jgi:hypothetical protein
VTDLTRAPPLPLSISLTSQSQVLILFVSVHLSCHNRNQYHQRAELKIMARTKQTPEPVTSNAPTRPPRPGFEDTSYMQQIWNREESSTIQHQAPLFNHPLGSTLYQSFPTRSVNSGSMEAPCQIGPQADQFLELNGSEDVQKKASDPASYTKPFTKFISENPTVFHAVDAIAEQLKDNGFKKLSERDTWKLEKGGKYYVERNGSSLVGFVVGEDYEPGNGVAMVAGHVDAVTVKGKFELSQY